MIRVSVKLGDGGVFERCPQFAPVACDAIRDAYRAAAAMCPAGAPHALEDHRIVLHAADTADIAVIDGALLGLAFTLAFALLWLNEQLDEHLATTGRLYWEGEWRVSAVDGVRAKADALGNAAGAQPACLMANPAHEAEARAAGQALLGVETVKQALRGAGLDLMGSSPTRKNSCGPRRMTSKASGLQAFRTMPVVVPTGCTSERACVSRSQADAAAAWALQAYGLVRHEGFYPKLGILRVLACAHRMQGEHEEADLYVDQIRALTVPADSHALRDRILDEAEEHPSPGGEVY